MLTYTRLGHHFRVPFVFLVASSSSRQRIGASALTQSRRTVTSAMSAAPKPTYGWCCTSSFNIFSDRAELKTIAGYGEPEADAFRLADEKRFDITTSPDWMEFIERSEDRMNDEGGAGAYDTLRCDLILESNLHEKWSIWGKKYHVNRLQNSYLSLVNHGQQDDATRSPAIETAIAIALAQSDSICDALLSEAESSHILNTNSYPDQPASSEQDDVVVQLVRLTLLWSPSQDTGSHDIVVRGHVCCSAKPMRVHRPVDPITVTVAAVGHDNEENVTVDTSLPTRFRDPQHKVASWARLRKTMEKPETYKPPGVSEVLMVRQSKQSSDLEVLEGLTSNLFVIYKDGTIRTAQDGVLYGFVRHLVLECAERCDLKLDPRPILLHEASEGLWQEAFITSSSRLIYPIARVLMFDDDQKDFVEYWRDTALTECTCPVIKPKWRQLLDDILERGGYPLEY